MMMIGCTLLLVLALVPLMKGATNRVTLEVGKLEFQAYQDIHIPFVGFGRSQ